MTVAPRFTLTFALQSEWHIGNGREGGAYADNLVIKDHLGLPVIPGKSIKGLLRQAMNEALTYQWLKSFDENTLITLFGKEGSALEAQGALLISSARLNSDELHYFEQHPTAKCHLFRVRHSTAINPEKGVAEEGALRAMEVVVPMTLTAELSIASHHPDWQPQWDSALPTWLEQSLPLIMALGGKRRRGLGEVIVTANVVKEK